MSGRAVGGAAGAGCGAFGLLSLLLGVGLTVFLGMRVFDSVGSPKKQADSVSDQVAAAGGSADASGKVSLTVPGTAGGPGELVLAPDRGFSDGARASLSGTGLTPGPVEVTQCLTNESRAAGVLGACDPSSTTTATVAADGKLAVPVTVKRVASVLESPLDCAAFARACVLVVHTHDSLDGSTQIGLVFAAGLPPTDAAQPPRG